MNTTNCFVKKLEMEYIILDLARFARVSVCILILSFCAAEK